MDSSELSVLQLIDRDFDSSIPIIHKEGNNDYAIILFTHYGVRIVSRVASESSARKVVNELIFKMKNDPAATG
jgi:hypothetical protein